MVSSRKDHANTCFKRSACDGFLLIKTCFPLTCTVIEYEFHLSWLTDGFAWHHQHEARGWLFTPSLPSRCDRNAWTFFDLPESTGGEATAAAAAPAAPAAPAAELMSGKTHSCIICTAHQTCRHFTNVSNYCALVTDRLSQVWVGALLLLQQHFSTVYHKDTLDDIYNL